MYSEITTAMVRGVEGVLVHATVDLSDGLPYIEMVGYLSSEVQEAKERMRSALTNSGVLFPMRKIIVNLTPAYLRKSGTGFDLPIVVALMQSAGIIPANRLQDTLIVGEIGLDGRILPICGLLPIADLANKEGYKRLIVPYDNQQEASLIDGIEVFGASNLKEVILYCQTGEVPIRKAIEQTTRQNQTQVDFSDIHGQLLARRACEIAAAGNHNILMIGPPGSGKTMFATRMPTILPPLTKEEQIEITKIYSVNGLLKSGSMLLEERPYREPHHTITSVGLIGGGRIPHPGELSLAHRGVLFLDELPEFHRETLEVLRQPIESHEVVITRAYGTYRFPANFMLVAAMNPCKCGYYPDMNRCNCTQASIESYVGRISRPLLDRIDLCVEVKAIPFDEMTKAIPEESSQVIRERVIKARLIQNERYKRNHIYTNSEMDVKLVERYCMLDKKALAHMKQVYEKCQLTSRGYHRILKVARTIADLEGRINVTLLDVEEAAMYRSIDRKYWER